MQSSSDYRRNAESIRQRYERCFAQKVVLHFQPTQKTAAKRGEREKPRTSFNLYFKLKHTELRRSNSWREKTAGCSSRRRRSIAIRSFLRLTLARAFVDGNSFARTYEESCRLLRSILVTRIAKINRKIYGKHARHLRRQNYSFTIPLYDGRILLYSANINPAKNIFMRILHYFLTIEILFYFYIGTIKFEIIV